MGAPLEMSRSHPLWDFLRLHPAKAHLRVPPPSASAWFPDSPGGRPAPPFRSKMTEGLGQVLPRARDRMPWGVGGEMVHGRIRSPT